MQETTCLEKQPLCQEMLDKMNAYWRATNYLSAGQLYLLDNPLLKKPLSMDQIKKKIVGHWGTVPGQNFVYVHCNRAIKRYDLDMILPAIRHNLGIGFVPTEFASEDLRREAVFEIPIAEKLPERNIFLVYDREYPQSIAAKTFQQFLLRS